MYDYVSSLLVTCGLRDYGTATWEGGDPECDHSPDKRRSRESTPVSAKQRSNAGSGTISDRDCSCGARRVDQGIGLEATPDAWVARLVEVFAEVRRVLRPDGTLWLNLGFSYDGRGNLIDQPNMLKDALVRDGWYCKCPIVWSKPNCMPSSQDKRPTIAHEMVYLMARDKGTGYFYDAVAIQEAATTTRPELLEFGPRPELGFPGHINDRRRAKTNGKWAAEDPQSSGRRIVENVKAARANGGNHDSPFGPSRQKRSVWTIPTESTPEAHFATFPQALVKPCVLAGTSERGCCAECGAPWQRVTERKGGAIGQSWHNHRRDTEAGMSQPNGHGSHIGDLPGVDPYSVRTTGWQPTCSHNADVQPCLVLDPFAGSGTTGLVALQYGRRFIGVELSSEYVAMARRRLAGAVAQEVLELA